MRGAARLSRVRRGALALIVGGGTTVRFAARACQRPRAGLAGDDRRRRLDRRWGYRLTRHYDRLGHDDRCSQRGRAGHPSGRAGRGEPLPGGTPCALSGECPATHEPCDRGDGPAQQAGETGPLERAAPRAGATVRSTPLRPARAGVQFRAVSVILGYLARAQSLLLAAAPRLSGPPAPLREGGSRGDQRRAIHFCREPRHPDHRPSPARAQGRVRLRAARQLSDPRSAQEHLADLHVLPPAGGRLVPDGAQPARRLLADAAARAGGGGNARARVHHPA